MGPENQFHKALKISQAPAKEHRAYALAKVVFLFDF
jgi:hypothetical protein